MAFPDFKLVLLCCAYGATHDLKDVCGGAAVAVLEADENPNYCGCTEVASGARRNRCDQPTVCQAPRANLDRFEQSGEGATRADGVGKIPLCEHNRLTGAQVRGHNCKRNAQVFKVTRIRNALEQILKAVIACQPEPGDAPTGGIPEAPRTASLNNTSAWSAAGVCRASDPGDARACEVLSRKTVLF